MAAPTSHRRTFLLGSTGALALFAGCIADPDDGSEPGAGIDDSNGSNGSDANESGSDSTSDDTDSETDATDSTADDTDESTGDAVTYETSRYRYPDSSTEPDATLLADRGDASDWLADRGLEDSIGAFVDDTPFADATLIAIEAAAPNACYEMGLEEIGVPDGMTDGGDALELEATVRDESDETEVCTQALTTVGVLVRATVDAEPVTEVSAVIVDGRDDEHEISAGVDTATSASE